MSNFANSFRAASNWTTTENGAAVKSTTNSALLDLFAEIGGLRNATEFEILNKWKEARRENAELADNLVLYTRSIRSGGIGERKLGRILLKALAAEDKEKVERNFDTIVENGRWDDLFVFFGTPVEKNCIDFIVKQWIEDIKSMKANKPISLLAKWMPSINTSSAETRKLARKFCSYLNVSEKAYRKTLSAMRKYLDVVEVKMSAQKFDKINYEAVPSVAMTRYRSSFGKHDFERFNKYILKVISGEKKINSSVSFPYELIAPYMRSRQVDPVIEAQWNAMPNFVEGNHNVIVMSDVSGSMSGVPMQISVSLGIYFAQHNTGAYKDMLVSFTDVPSLYTLNPKQTLCERARKVLSHVGYNTNLDGALKAIYDLAVQCGEAPKALVIISDGEIDYFCRSGRQQTICNKWEKKYTDAGLECPKIIMWNCECRGDRFIGDASNDKISYISGASAATFKHLNTLINENAYESMVKILSKKEFCWK